MGGPLWPGLRGGVLVSHYSRGRDLVLGAYLVRIIFFRDEVNNGLNELRVRRGVMTVRVVQFHPGLSHFLM